MLFALPALLPQTVAAQAVSLMLPSPLVVVPANLGTIKQEALALLATHDAVPALDLPTQIAPLALLASTL